MRLFPVLLFAGCETADPTACEAMCDELVKVCAYTAFPSWDSCVEGCLYDQEQGARIEGQADCVADAACDTFAILECQNEYGPSSP